MVLVKFMSLLRSKYNITSFECSARDMREVLDYIKKTYPKVQFKDIDQAILFINQEKVSHRKRFETPLKPGDIIVFTNFVGGG